MSSVHYRKFYRVEISHVLKNAKPLDLDFNRQKLRKDKKPTLSHCLFDIIEEQKQVRSLILEECKVKKLAQRLGAVNMTTGRCKENTW